MDDQMKVVRMPFNRMNMMQFDGISLSLFKDMLNLMPPDTTFVGCGTDSNYFLDYLLFASKTFADVQDGGIIPQVIPHFKRESDGTVKIIKIDFDGFKDPSSQSCTHFWRTYSGINETYDYCQNCGVKK